MLFHKTRNSECVTPFILIFNLFEESSNFVEISSGFKKKQSLELCKTLDSIFT